jgi:hypothetical protein
MVLTKEELMQRIRDRIGDGTTDDDIALMEDAADTLAQMDTPPEDGENWKERYEIAEADWQAKYDQQNDEWQNKLDELDAAWRRRYIDRFNGEVKDDDIIEDTDDMDDEVVGPTTYEELFTQDGGTE